MDYRALAIAMTAQMIQRLEPIAIAEMHGRTYLEWYHALRLTQKDFVCALFMQYDYNPDAVSTALDALWHNNQEEVFNDEEEVFYDEEEVFHDHNIFNPDVTYVVVLDDDINEMPQV